MQVEYTGRQVIISAALRTQAEDGIDRIGKILGKATGAHVILSVEKYRNMAEVNIVTRFHDIVGASESTSMETALREALDKAETQAIRCKKKIQSKKRQPKEEKLTAEPALERPRKAAPSLAADIEEPVVSKKTNGKTNGNGNGNGHAKPVIPVTVHSFPSKTAIPEPHVVRSIDSVAMRPMSLEEAVKEAEFRDREVFVFRDKAGALKVLHRKRDGKMELIEVP
ncbi:ribosome hibernation-promoting factor, HPF/YfiA family [Silvibacterium acidisoli]|uniref:ribosome hibernation-promoting factor, HPF/YfiA family n=1 Tax=Acidobacteriaceae bacterium ZG23-2 TaxID=2883246 RepID=UPI00406C034D